MFRFGASTYPRGTVTKLGSYLSAIAFAGWFLSGIPADASVSVLPVSIPAGYYTVTSILQGSSGSCSLPLGTGDVALFTYPGPGKTGAVDRGIYDKEIANELFVRETSFSKTPTGRAANWSGSFTTVVKNQTPTTNSYTGTFSATLSIQDSSAANFTWIGVFTFQYPATDPTCTLTMQRVFYRIVNPALGH